MKALPLDRLVLAAVALGALMVGVIVALAPYMHLILWGMVAFVVLATLAGLWYRRHLIRDEATPPFASGPAPQRSVTRGLERPVVAGVVISSEEVTR